MYSRIMGTCKRLYGSDLVINKIPYFIGDYNKTIEHYRQAALEAGAPEVDER